MHIQTTVLPNGLTVITNKLVGFETAAVAVFVRAGSRNENLENNGIAHFLEHMAFKGTHKRTALQIASEVEDIGSNINAYTSQGITCYHVTGLRDHVRESIDILGDVMTNSVFDQKEINSESGVILQEIAQYLDDPSSVASDGFGFTMYPDHPIGRTILGDPDFIRAAKTKDFFDFTSRNYVANNMLVVGTGGVEHEEFCAMVGEYFSGLTTGPVPTVEAPIYRGGIYRNSAHFEQVNLLVGFNSVPIVDETVMSHQLFSSAFGGGMSSPLFQEVREKRGLVYSVYAYADCGIDYGDFTIGGGMTPENVDTFFDVAFSELRKACGGLTEQDFRRAKTQNLVSLRTLGEKPLAIGRFLAGRYFDFGRIVSPNELIDRLKKVTLDEVLEAGRVIINSNPTISLVGPAPATDYHALVKEKLS